MNETMIDKKNKGMILEIVRMSTEDGPGIRTTVFFKGCTLQCAWCHNPESISPKPQLCWVGNRCIGCKTCLSVCPENALSMTKQGIQIDRSLCNACGVCATECPGTALELLGKVWSLDALVDEVIKDRAYFETSGGGVTISGGEPTMQPEFAGAFLKALRGKGLHTALDTCGQCGKEALERILPYAVLVMFDMKLMDAETHRRFTGHSNKRIIDNLRFVADYIASHVYPRELWIRTPVIPGATATQENINGIGRFIAKNLSRVISRWELCAFNNLCRDKYLRLDRKWAFDDSELLSKEFMEEMADVARKSGVNPEIVNWSGSTRLETEEIQQEAEDGI